MEIVAVVAIVVSMAACAVAGYCYYQARCWVLQAEAERRVLQGDMRALAAAASGVGERVRELEQRLHSLSRRQEQQEINEPGGHSYLQARKLARRGAGAEELIDIYGLTRGEAELLSMLHRMEKDEGMEPQH